MDLGFLLAEHPEFAYMNLHGQMILINGLVKATKRIFKHNIGT